AAPGHAYPPILIATSRRDDRAHPGHARKMAAKLQAMGYEALFYELATGGHSYGKDHDDMAAFISLSYAFLRRANRLAAGLNPIGPGAVCRVIARPSRRPQDAPGRHGTQKRPRYHRR